MAKKGLTKDRIIHTALAQIEEHGLPAFSLRSLASALEIQVSSLYNHIQGQKELLAEVGLRAVHMLAEQEEQAVAGQRQDEALFALADAYRRFAREHTELYHIIMDVHTLEIPLLESAAEQIAKPILHVLADYGITGPRQIHYQRLLRSVMHGFFAHETSGGFTASAVDREESYHFSIACIAAQLNAEPNKPAESSRNKQSISNHNNN